MKTKKNTFVPLHDTMTYSTYRISLDYKKKEVLYDMGVYGNFTHKKIIQELDNLKRVDGSFKKFIFVSSGTLEHYVTSPTYKDSIVHTFQNDIFGKFEIFTGKEKSGELIPVTMELIKLIQDTKKEKSKIERFFRTLKKSEYVPHVKLKILSLKDIGTRSATDYEIMAMLYNGQAVETIAKYFKQSDWNGREINLDKTYFQNFQEGIGLSTINALEKAGFKFFTGSKRYQNIKASAVFNTLDSENEAAQATA